MLPVPGLTIKTLMSQSQPNNASATHVRPPFIKISWNRFQCLRKIAEMVRIGDPNQKLLTLVQELGEIETKEYVKLLDETS